MYTTIMEVQHPSHVSDDMLACKVCLDRYDSADQRPRALHCNHTFCERCIHEHLLQRNKNKIVCPLCRARTRFNGHQNTGVHCLPVNVTAVGLAKQSRQTNEPPGHTGQTPDDGGLPRGVHRVVAKRVFRLHPSPNEQSESDDWSSDQRRFDSSFQQVGDFMHARSDETRTNTETTFSQMRNQMSRGVDAISSQDRLAVISMARHVEPSAAALESTTLPLEPSAVYVGRFGKYQDPAAEAHACKPGTFVSPSHVAFLPPSARGGSGRVAVLDKASSAVQLFTDNGDFLSLIYVDGARAACFVVPADGSELVESHRVAIATDRGVSLFDQLGRLEKAIPVADVVIALAGYESGFVAAHSNRVTVCHKLVPAVAMSTIGSVFRRRSLSMVQFRGIVDVAVHVSRYRDPRNAPGGNGTSIYILDVDTVYVVDPATSGLRGIVRLLHDDIVDNTPIQINAKTSSLRPVSITVDPTSGHVIVSDSEKRRISSYQCCSGEDDSGTERRPVRLLVQLGATMSAIENCGHVTVGTGGLLYVVVLGAGIAEVRIYRM